MKTENILVAVDFSKYSEPSVKAAVKLGKPDNCKIHLLHVEEDVFRIKAGHSLTCMDRELIPVIEKFHSSMITECSKKVNELLHKIPEPVRGKGVVLEGHSVDTILKYIDENSIDVVVLGSHGHTNLASTLLGSTTETIVRKASCSVFIVKDGSRR